MIKGMCAGVLGESVNARVWDSQFRAAKPEEGGAQAWMSLRLCGRGPEEAVPRPDRMARVGPVGLERVGKGWKGLERPGSGLQGLSDRMRVGTVVCRLDNLPSGPACRLNRPAVWTTCRRERSCCGALLLRGPPGNGAGRLSGAYPNKKALRHERKAFVALRRCLIRQRLPRT